MTTFRVFAARGADAGFHPRRWFVIGFWSTARTGWPAVGRLRPLTRRLPANRRRLRPARRFGRPSKQTGVLLPSATVFLLLLCNDRAVLGPWVNSSALNLFTGAIVAALVMLSAILTASVLFPDMEEKWIIDVLVGGSALAVAVTVLARLYARVTRGDRRAVRPIPRDPQTWRMPSLEHLPPARLSTLSRTWMVVLRGYLVVAAGLVLVRIAQLATAGA
jgi:hypothetical protein